MDTIILIALGLADIPVVETMDHLYLQCHHVLSERVLNLMEVAVILLEEVAVAGIHMEEVMVATEHQLAVAEIHMEAAMVATEHQAAVVEIHMEEAVVADQVEAEYLHYTLLDRALEGHLSEVAVIHLEEEAVDHHHHHQDQAQA
jgi:hypothetical protein